MQIDEAISSAEKLSVFPKSALKIRTIVSNAETSFKDLERAVALDPALSAQVLKIANSPYFGVSRQITHLRQALILLGYEATRDMALALSLLSLAQKQSASGTRLWEHSLRTAVAARLLCRAAHPSMAGEAFVAGLLHDLGKPIMELVASDHVVNDSWADGSSDRSLDEETAHFGFNHAELGAACMEYWKLSESTCVAIRYHHQPVELPIESSAGMLARFLNLANQIAHDPSSTHDEWKAELEALSLSDRLTVDHVRSINSDVPGASELLGFD